MPGTGAREGPIATDESTSDGLTSIARPGVGAVVAAAIAVAVVTAVVFSSTIGFGFLDWDDRGLLLGHDRFHGLDGESLQWMFTTLHAGHYQPLTWISYSLNHAAGGLEPSGYHAVNVLLHAMTSALLVPLFLSLWRLGLPAKDEESTLRPLIVAVAAALLYAIHPLRVESVAWITERRDVLSGFLLTAATLAWLTAAERKSAARQWRVVAFVLFAFSLLAKGWGITFPVVLLVLDAWPLRRLGGGPGRWFGQSVRRVWAEKIPFAVLSVAAAAVAPFAQDHAGVLVRTGEVGIAGRIALAFNGLAHYLQTTLLPMDLIPLVERPVALDPMAPRFLVAVVLVAVLAAVLVRFARRLPGAAAAGFVYLVVLSPVLGLVQSGPQMTADRYTYLAAIPLSALLGGGLLMLLRRRPSLTVPALVVTFALAAVSGVATRAQCSIWESDRTLWEHTLRIDPDSRRAHVNLGVVHEKAGERDRAEASFRRALELHEGYTKARLNLAAVLHRTGRVDEAERENREALRLDPKSPAARGACAFDDLRGGDAEEALATFLDLMEQEPLNHRWVRGAGLAEASRGNPDAARRHLVDALRLSPGDGENLDAMATLEAATGRVDDAIERLQSGLRDEPSHGHGWFTLGSLQAQRQRWEQAEEALRRAIRHLPASAEARFNLAVVLVQSNRRGEALDLLEEAAALDPEDVQVREALEALRKESGG